MALSSPWNPPRSNLPRFRSVLLLLVSPGGTSHVLSKDEAKFLSEKGCEQLILGSGQMGNVHLSSEAEAYFYEKRLQGAAVAAHLQAIRAFNRSHAKKIGLFT